jgi:hypothetical protein
LLLKTRLESIKLDKKEKNRQEWKRIEKN